MNAFCKEIEEQIPRLRRYARALTHNRERADDLVQSCLERALAKSHLWESGTNLRAWLFTILHNLHVNEVRRGLSQGVAVPIEDAASAMTLGASQETALQLRDLDRAMAKVSEEQRQVLLLIGLEGMNYEEAAAVLQIPTGTVRSRLSRGREELRRLMGMEARKECQTTLDAA